MLVLSRKKQEQVLVSVNGVDIWIKVIDCGIGRCRLGFDAPKDVKILREELLNKEKENAV